MAACRYGYDPSATPEEGGATPDAASDDLDGAFDANGMLDANDMFDANGMLDDGGAAPDGGGCDPTVLLTDSFSGATADPRWDVFASSGTSASSVNGRLRVTLPSSGVFMGYAGYLSNGSYDLSGRRMSIEVPTMVDTSGHAQVLLQLIESGNGAYRAGFEQQNGMLHMFTRSGGFPRDLSIVYDATRHRYWQLRENAGVLFFETSPDGTTWTIRFNPATPFDARQVHIELIAGIYQPEIAPGFGEFDNLGGTVAVGTSCKQP